jgi:hypothetical protein
VVRSLPGPVDRDLSGLVGELSTRSEAGRAGGPRMTFAPTTPGSSASIPVVGDLVLSFNDETVRRRRPDDGAEPSSPSHDALNLHGSWAATLD